MKPEENQGARRAGRWELLRDLLTFQAKLFLDGMRDVLLSPASILAVAWGLLTDPRRPDRTFRRLIDFGARSERWINLFGQHPADGDESGIDEVFSRLEARVLDQYERGGMTAQAKEAVDRAFDHLQDRIEEAEIARAVEAPSPQRPPALPTVPGPDHPAGASSDPD